MRYNNLKYLDNNAPNVIYIIYNAKTENFFLKPQIVSQVFTTESIQMNQAVFNVP